MLNCLIISRGWLIVVHSCGGCFTGISFLMASSVVNEPCVCCTPKFQSPSCSGKTSYTFLLFELSVCWSDLIYYVVCCRQLEDRKDKIKEETRLKVLLCILSLNFGRILFSSPSQDMSFSSPYSCPCITLGIYPLYYVGAWSLVISLLSVPLFHQASYHIRS